MGQTGRVVSVDRVVTGCLIRYGMNLACIYNAAYNAAAEFVCDCTHDCTHDMCI